MPGKKSKVKKMVLSEDTFLSILFENRPSPQYLTSKLPFSIFDEMIFL